MGSGSRQSHGVRVVSIDNQLSTEGYYPLPCVERLAGAEDDDPRVRSALRDLGTECLRVLPDRREGVVVAGDDRLRADELGSAGGIVRTHREVVADGQDGDVDAFVAD